MYAQYISYSEFSVSESQFREKALIWANQFPVVAYYTSNNIPYNFQGFENILAVSNNSQNIIVQQNAFKSMNSAAQANDSILCGILSYDLKNQVEKLSSKHSDLVEFPDIYFFKPDTYFVFDEDGLTINSSNLSASEILKAIINIPSNKLHVNNNLNINHKVNKSTYIKNVEAIRQHILEGDVYEINYCIEFFSEAASVDPLTVFLALNKASPMPFAGYFKLGDKFLLCASPERFIKKEGSKLISQPIKGTRRRGNTPEEDEELKTQLRHDEKEIAENMMIMDLVRNDLSKSSEIGSVKVEEMFGIYPFRQVFQMITTVTSQVKKDCQTGDILKNAFPMGSMTGAPKIRSMQLIEQYETTKRGIFSGSLGHIKANGDFDFNVIIRSLQYNAQTGYLSFMVGSAITYDSDPEQEYAECLLKAQAIMDVLQNIAQPI